MDRSDLTRLTTMQIFMLIQWCLQEICRRCNVPFNLESTVTLRFNLRQPIQPEDAQVASPATPEGYFLGASDPNDQTLFQQVCGSRAFQQAHQELFKPNAWILPDLDSLDPHV